MKRVLSIFFVICLLLCACTKAPAEQTTEQAQVTTVNVTTEQTTEAATSEPTRETTVPDTTGDTTPIDLKYQNPLTGEPLAELYTARPFAVMINNSSYAQPMCSLNSADIVFEILAEGGITRCMAVFGDVAGHSWLHCSSDGRHLPQATRRSRGHRVLLVRSSNDVKDSA